MIPGESGLSLSTVFSLPKKLRALLALGLLAIAGCQSEGGFRYLALGDSYTIGEGVSAEEGWPARLSTMLRQTGVDVRETRIVAQTGWTTGELLEAIRIQKPEGPFDLVTLLIGVNNQYRGESVDLYRTMPAPDGLHPSAKMHLQWAHLAKATLDDF